MSQIKINEKLGEGSYGKVYSCEYDGKKYAIKFLNCAEIGFSPNEIDIMRQLKHNNIITMKNIFNSIQSPEIFKTYGWGKDVFQSAILLPYCEQTLEQYVISDKWNINDVKKYINSIIDAMYYLHYHNYLHLDLKLENILISNNDIKIIDFGQAQYVPYQTSRTINVHFVTPVYRPPELLKSKDGDNCEYFEGTDIWGLGLIFLELLSRKVGEFEDFNNKKLKSWINTNFKNEEVKMKFFKTELKHLDDEDFKFYSKLLCMMLEIDKGKRINMEGICNYLNIKTKEGTKDFIELKVEKVVNMNPKVIPHIKNYIDDIKTDINFATIFLIFEMFYRIIQYKNVTDKELQYHIFIGCVNMAFLMNEKSYINMKNSSTNIDETFGHIWALIVLGTRCSFRTNKSMMVDTETFEKLKKCLYDGEEFMNLQIKEGPINLFSRYMFN